MNLSSILKVLLPGLVPLVIFIAADAVFGEAVALVVAVVAGVVEFVYTLAKEKRADPFVVVDTGLLVVAGGISYLLRDDLFFKLKPAVVETIFAAGMGTLLALPPAYLKSYMTRMLRGMSLPDAAMAAMKRNLALLLGVLGLHVAATVYAALALSNAAWGFVSGGLLYLLFGLVVAGQFLAAWRANGWRWPLGPARHGEEILPLVDEEGRVLGTARRSECHAGPGRLHPVVHLHIGDGAGRIYLQKRAADKLVEPGKWDTAVGGHVAAGEDLDTALARELREELGVTSLALAERGAKPAPVARYRWDTEIESELVFSFWLNYRGPFAPDAREVAEGRFWSIEEIRKSVGTGVFTPNFEHEFGLLERAAGSKSAL